MAAVSAFALYLSTLAPTVLWGDDAELQRLAILGRAAGGARNYELWTVLVHPFTHLPLGDPAWRVTLACGLFAALAVGTMFVVLVEAKCPPGMAAVGVIALAVSHTFWLHAVRTEVYSLLALVLAMAMAALMAWHRRPAKGSLLAVGLTLSVTASLAHPLALTFLPGVALSSIRPRTAKLERAVSARRR